MMTKRFVLYGIHGVYNYGCEGIVRGTAATLRAVWPECEVFYLSRRPDADRAALEESPVQVVDNRNLSRRHPKRVARGLLKRLRLPYDWVLLDNFRSLRRNDCLLSIGGDIFTLGPGPYPKHGGVRELEVPRRILATGRHFVLWAASVGPFEAWPESVPEYREILQRLTMITVREPETRRYLAGLGVERNVIEVADPAYLLAAKPIDSDWPFPPPTQPTLGVNLSPLSVVYTSGPGALDRVLGEQAAFLDQLRKKLNVRLLLIPHVVAPHHPPDDDYGYLEKLQKLIPFSREHPVALLPANLGARRTKGVIQKCDAVLAARMHCAIASVSSAVPTLFVSYSSKARGMAEFVYGNPRWVLPLEALTTSGGMEKVTGLFDERARLRESLLLELQRFTKTALAAGPALASRLASPAPNH